MINRLFAFGCSNTHYNWPTWADYLGYSALRSGAEFHNFALAGAGNQYHLNSAIRAQTQLDMGNQPGDVIMVMFSSWCRADGLYMGYQTDPVGGGRSGLWSQGNTHSGDWLPDDYVRKYWSLEDDIIRNITSIQSFIGLFTPTVCIQTGAPYEGLVEPGADPLLDTLQRYSDRLPGTDYWEPPDRIQPVSPDGHPSVTEHLTWATQIGARYLPELDLSGADTLTSEWQSRCLTPLDDSEQAWFNSIRPACDWWMGDREGPSEDGWTSHEYHTSTAKDLWGPGMVDIPGYRWQNSEQSAQGPQRRELISHSVHQYLKNWCNKT